MKKTARLISVLALVAVLVLSLASCAPSSYTFNGEFQSPGSDTVLPFTLSLNSDKSAKLDSGEYGAWDGTWTKEGDDISVTFSDYSTDIGEDADYILVFNEEYPLTYTAAVNNGVHSFKLNMAIDLTWYVYPFELELTEAK